MLSKTISETTSYFSDLKDESVILKRVSLLTDFLFQPRIPGIIGKGVSIQKENTMVLSLITLIGVKYDVVSVTYSAMAVLQFYT